MSTLSAIAQYFVAIQTNYIRNTFPADPHGFMLLKWPHDRRLLSLSDTYPAAAAVKLDVKGDDDIHQYIIIYLGIGAQGFVNKEPMVRIQPMKIFQIELCITNTTKVEIL